jgi:hypothetical protein
MSQPLTTESVTQVSISGVRAEPARVAEPKRTPWTKSGTKEMAPKRPIPVKKPRALDTVKTRFRKSTMGRRGSFAFRSRRRKRKQVRAEPRRSSATEALRTPSPISMRATRRSVPKRKKDSADVDGVLGPSAGGSARARWMTWSRRAEGNVDDEDPSPHRRSVMILPRADHAGDAQTELKTPWIRARSSRSRYR